MVRSKFVSNDLSGKKASRTLHQKPLLRFARGPSPAAGLFANQKLSCWSHLCLVSVAPKSPMPQARILPRRQPGPSSRSPEPRPSFRLHERQEKRHLVEVPFSCLQLKVSLPEKTRVQRGRRTLRVTPPSGRKTCVCLFPLGSSGPQSRSPSSPTDDPACR